MIATFRIDKYDGDFVTFHYNRNENDAYVEETISVMEFTERLIRHMSGDDLLDMDYFLNEDDLFDDDAGVEGFYIF